MDAQAGGFPLQLILFEEVLPRVTEWRTRTTTIEACQSRYSVMIGMGARTYQGTGHRKSEPK
jgi:hypothetical protein